MRKYHWEESKSVKGMFFMVVHPIKDIYWVTHRLTASGNWCVFRVNGEPDRSTRQFFNTLAEAKQYAETMEAVGA